MEKFNQYANPKTIKMLVGNKSDLGSKRVVSQQDAETFAKENRMTYTETSALDASNIEAVFIKTVEGKDLLLVKKLIKVRYY